MLAIRRDSSANCVRSGWCCSYLSATVELPAPEDLDKSIPLPSMISRTPFITWMSVLAVGCDSLTIARLGWPDEVVPRPRILGRRNGSSPQLSLTNGDATVVCLFWNYGTACEQTVGHVDYEGNERVRSLD